MATAPLERLVLQALRHHDLLRPGDRVLVAVSGGADSVALLRLLLSVAKPLNLSLVAAHLDHGIRQESADDAAFVATLCAALAVPLITERCDVPAAAREGRRGIEEAARDLRRAFLQRVAAQQHCAAIALGHHRDDQAETVLHRLLRGSGLSGLVAMRFRSGPFIRPLLTLSRRQLRAYLLRQGLAHVEDPTNSDVALTRNRLRHELLPQLRSFNPRIDRHLARLSRRIALEEDYWRSEEDRLLQALGSAGPEELWLDIPGLLALHPAVRLRLLRRALGEVRGSLRRLDAVHIEAVEALVLSARPQAEVRLPQAWAARRYQRLWLRRQAPGAVDDFELPLPGPGDYRLPDGRWLRVTLDPDAVGETPWAAEFAAAQVAFPLQVRNFRPGDRFRPLGMEGHKKLKNFFIDAKIEREARRRLPLVVADEILWLPGVRRCAGRSPLPGAGMVLRLELLPVANDDKTLVRSKGL